MQRFRLRDFYNRSHDHDLQDSDFYKNFDRLKDITGGLWWLAGGSVRRAVKGEKQESDMDIFFANVNDYQHTYDALLKAGAWHVGSNEHNVTLRLPAEFPKPVADDEFTPHMPELEIQLITTQWYSSAEAVIDSFDFTICQFAVDGPELVCGDFALWDLARNRLVPHRITYATATLRRMLKYTKQGYTICSGGLSKILQDVAADPSTINAEVLYID